MTRRSPRSRWPVLISPVIASVLCALNPSASSAQTEGPTFALDARPRAGIPAPVVDVSGTTPFPDGAVVTISVRGMAAPEADGEPEGGDPLATVTCEVGDGRFEGFLDRVGGFPPGVYRIVAGLDVGSQPTEIQEIYARRRPPRPVERILRVGRAADLAAWLDREAKEARAEAAGLGVLLEELTQAARDRRMDPRRAEETGEKIEELFSRSRARTSASPLAEAWTVLGDAAGSANHLVPRKGAVVGPPAGADPLAVFYEIETVQDALRDAPKLLKEVESHLRKERRARLAEAGRGLLLALAVPGPKETEARRLAEAGEDARALAAAVPDGDADASPLRDALAAAETIIAGWTGVLPPDAAARLAPLARDLEGIRGELRR